MVDILFIQKNRKQFISRRRISKRIGSHRSTTSNLSCSKNQRRIIIRARFIFSGKLKNWTKVSGLGLVTVILIVRLPETHGPFASKIIASSFGRYKVAGEAIAQAPTIMPSSENYFSSPSHAWLHKKTRIYCPKSCNLAPEIKWAWNFAKKRESAA